MGCQEPRVSQPEAVAATAAVATKAVDATAVDAMAGATAVAWAVSMVGRRVGRTAEAAESLAGCAEPAAAAWALGRY